MIKRTVKRSKNLHGKGMLQDVSNERGKEVKNMATKVV